MSTDTLIAKGILDTFWFYGAEGPDHLNQPITQIH